LRHVTAAALMLTVIGTLAYSQLTIHAGHTQRPANSPVLVPAALSGVGDIASLPEEALLASNVAIDGNIATEPPAQASPAPSGPAPSPSGPAPSPSGPLSPSIQPVLTASVFQAVTADDADQPHATIAAELSVALLDNPVAVWLVLDSLTA
jgi:hypothetical protein